MRNIESLDLGFENCEVLSIPSKYIGTFYLKDITKQIGRIASNSITEMSLAKNLYLQIKSDADKLTLWMDQETKPFKRLADSKDLVSVSAIYEGGEKEEVYVEWAGENDYVNPNQSVAFNEETGDCFLAVCGKQTVDDYFIKALSEKEATYWKSFK